MTTLGYKRLLLTGFFVLAALAHLIHNSMASLFLFPVLVAVILPYSYQPTWLTGTLVIFSELLSTLPPGVMMIVIISPWLIRKIFSSVDVSLSGTFYLLIGGTVAWELLVMTTSTVLTSNSGIPLSFQDAFVSVPVGPIIQTFFATSLLAYAMLILWNEIIPSHDPVKPLFAR